MHDDSVLVERRIRRELTERLMPAMYRATTPMTVTAWEAPGEPVAYRDAIEALDRDGRKFRIGQHYGRPWGTTWFRLTTDVPADWVGPSLEAVIDLGFHPDSAGFQSEGLVWAAGDDGNGAPVQGIHPRRTAFPLGGAVAGPLEVVIEAASNPAFPMKRMDAATNLGSLRTAGRRPLYRLREASLAVRDDDVFHLLLDMEVLLGVFSRLPRPDKRRQRLLRQLEAALDAVDLRDIGGTAAKGRAVLRPALDVPARHGAHHVIGVGHAHIDSAWLWPVRETVRKCARTFASATQMIDAYPEYRFVCSQAAQYEWMEQRYPALFERVRQRVATGAWQPVGGMWVEADMNLPSGESIVRQLIHGQRYFESRFGKRCAEVWIPDVFGYPATLPQIFRAGGCERFVTQKLSWNKQNVFPHSTFWWEGLDGSRVLTHFPPVDTYNASVTGEQMVFSDRNFKDHGWSDWSLMPYGFGNGGGGPTREMIERAGRLADLDGAPRLTLGTTDDFFRRVEAEAAAGAPVPVWSGELYFEMHRGTLTSQSRTKVGNRRCEALLHDAELWWATACPDGLPSEVSADLDRLWKDLLLQQFHDIIPGSSITWVHDDAEAEHTRIAARASALVSTAIERVAPAVPTVVNSAQFRRCEVVVAGQAPTGDGPVQHLRDGSVAFLAAVPGFGIAPAEAEPTADRVVVTERSFTNSFLSVSWNLEGSITSIIDIPAARELIPTGHAITLELAADHPVEYDAWDVEEWTRGSGAPVRGVESVDIVEHGPLVAVLEVRRRFGDSSMVQRSTLRAGSPRLDLTFDVDWHEDEQLLSLMVPLDVRTREAACDIQFGHVMRPTHASTSWDAAKFEVCAHRYVDLAEPEFGVAVLNDGRYGHSVQHADGVNGVRVSLLRAAKYPDPEQDHGAHQVTIGVVPHGPGLHAALREAVALNSPLRVVAGGAGSSTPEPVVSIDHPGVEVAAVKRADDGSGDLVVRLAEMCGSRSQVTLRIPGRVTEAHRCNALEERQVALHVPDGAVDLTMRPFELVTLRVSGGEAGHAGTPAR